MDFAMSSVENLRQNGWIARPNPDVAETFAVEGGVTLVGAAPHSTAELTACYVDSGVAIEPNAGPGGSDRIVSDEISARRVRVVLSLDGDTWKVYDRTLLGSWEATSCPEA